VTKRWVFADEHGETIDAWYEKRSGYVASKTGGWAATIYPMKILLYVALVLFAGSFWLPAYAGGDEPMSGWTCLQFCWTTPWDESMEFGWKVYYFGFVIGNLALPLLAVLRLVKPSTARVVRWVSLVPLMHVLSWWVINVTGDQTFFHNVIRYGYYVWLGAFVLLALSLFMKDAVSAKAA
jgi:hypothetical protein